MGSEACEEGIAQFSKGFGGHAKEFGQWKSLKCLNWERV